MGSRLRILFIAPIVSGSITEQRILSLERNNCDVVTFNLQDYYDKFNNPISRRLAFKYNFKLLLNSMNKAIENFIEKSDYDIAIINKGIVISPKLVKSIKEKSNKNYILHYSADPTLITHKTRYFTNSIPFYDLCVTTKSYEIELYPQYNPKRVEFINQGYDKSFVEIAKKSNKREYLYDVVFIGRLEEHYAKALREVIKITENVAFWGPWEKQIRLYPDLAKFWKGSSVFGEEYVLKLREGRICLGLLCKYHPDQSTTRTFEIPASGSFMLTERTAEHESLFIDGQEAVFFDTYHDLGQKVRYYLDNENIRKKIEIAGFKRCIDSNYSNDNRMKEILDIVRGELDGN
ncbi:CgeB family protein [Streptococcus parasuis]|uniref:CgeB family protein n=1 Tax=Streptococcus parasuis TaxID=1501662 RepID=UPI002FDAEF05